MATGTAFQRIGLFVIVAVCGAAFFPPASAQLTSAWTVKANGQTVQVNDGGGFVLPNISIPDQFGADGPGSAPDFVSDEYIVVTGFAVIDGVTLYAYSAPFKITQGETFLLEDLTITTTPPPFPQEIEIFSPANFVAIDGTLPLTTIGTLLGGSTLNVTQGSTGTSYRTSNPNILGVDANGVVTGKARGTAFITASNNGATAVRRLLVAAGTEVTTVTGVVFSGPDTPLEGVNVVLPGLLSDGETVADGSFEITGVSATSGPVAAIAQHTTEAGTFVGASDSVPAMAGGFTDLGILQVRLVCDQLGEGCVDTDLDGVPDALEATLGTDPNLADSNGNSVPDGEEDFDGDGLSNAAEAFLASSPNSSDADFDGLNDGNEFRYGTNPTVADTDEDGLTDGEEVNSLRTDPLIPDNQAPVVTLNSPNPALEYIRGDFFSVSASATDDGRVVLMEAFVNGVSVGTSQSTFFSSQLRVPAEGESFMVEVIARDSNENQGTSGVLQVPSLPDPLTTVIGRVIDQESAPVADADVFLRGVPGFFEISGTDGAFEFTGVPTVNGSIAANARIQSEGDFFLVGQSGSFSPIRSGTTNVGDVRLSPDTLTEGFFDQDFDLQNTTLIFTPNESGSVYSLCTASAEALPVSTANATPVTFSDDTFLQINLTEGAAISFYGVDYPTLFIGSNGYITFVSGDSTYNENFDVHYSQGRPRISGLFDDHHPGRGGTVSYEQLSDRFVFTFENVPHFSTAGANTFQIEVFFSGVVRLTYLELSNTGGLIGLSPGLGTPATFSESDLSTYPLCTK